MSGKAGTQSKPIKEVFETLLKSEQKKGTRPLIAIPPRPAAQSGNSK